MHLLLPNANQPIGSGVLLKLEFFEINVLGRFVIVVGLCKEEIPILTMIYVRQLRSQF